MCYIWHAQPDVLAVQVDVCLICQQLVCFASQLHASASTLQLVTFDADGTLYADGAHMAQV
jgi:hypothetical protein